VRCSVLPLQCVEASVAACVAVSVAVCIVVRHSMLRITRDKFSTMSFATVSDVESDMLPMFVNSCVAACVATCVEACIATCIAVGCDNLQMSFQH